MTQTEVELQQLLIASKDVLVIDMARHAMALPENPFLNALNPAPSGMYMPGSIVPELSDSVKYYSKVGAAAKTPFTSAEAAVASKGALYNANGSLMFDAQKVKNWSRLLRKEPTVPVMLINTAFAVVLDYLNNLSRKTFVNCQHYVLEDLVHESYQDMVVDGAFREAYKDLIEEVVKFVGNDTWHHYYYKVFGTALVIEKGADWRIHEYYRMTIAQEEAEQDRRERHIS